MSRGRGRSRGGMSKAALEQLTLSKNDFGKEPFIPPETFPPLLFHPVKNAAERSEANNYMLMLKRELREHFSASEYHVSLDSKKPDIERYLDAFNFLNVNKPQQHFDKSRYPKELWPDEPSSSISKKRSLKVQPKVNTKRAKVKDGEYDNKLEKLLEKDGTDEGEKKEEDKEDQIIEEEEEVVDEEMDEGTDYINSYFDNGESYIDDEGDALEEEGIF